MKAPLNELLDSLEDRGVEHDEEALLDAFASWAADTGRPLYPHQQESLLELLAGSHVVAQTPTGSGKSMIAMAAHFISLARGGRSYYSAPLKALVSEKFFDLVDVFGAPNVGLVTGDVALNPDAPIICCTAEILANQALRQGASLDADTVVLDEFHFYADPQRGWAWQVPIMQLTRAQFVLLSATLGDTTELTADLQRRTGRPASVISDAERPVPLEFDYLVDALPTVVERLVDEHRSPVYIVHFTQADAVKTAVDLARTLPLTVQRKEELRAELQGQSLDRGFGKRLRELLLKGVGVHHAGMLPRYRRLVERLTQKGLLSIVCGTDTLGVGINVPIRTVLFTSLVKFDGRRTRHLSAREFHQIAGRAGRPGFDDEGSVRVLASEAEIESAKRRARMTAAQEEGDAAKRRKLAKRAAKVSSSSSKKAAAGRDSVSWNRATFERLVAASPETLTPHFQTSHSMFLNVLQGDGDPEARLIELAGDAADAQSRNRSGGKGRVAPSQPEETSSLPTSGTTGKGSLGTDGTSIEETGSQQPRQAPETNRFLRQFGDIYRSLLQAGLIERVKTDNGGTTIRAVGDLPDDFALNQPLTPFALAALDLLDPESPEFSMDVLSVIESVMEDPFAVLYAQQRKARDAAFAQMRAEGVEYEERRDRVEQVTWPKPLEEVLIPAFDVFAVTNPWVRSHEPSPKRIVREMVEEGLTFSQFIAKYDLPTSEGLLLRYLSDTYRALRQVLPDSYKTPQIEEITDWLRDLLGSVDTSLLAEWEDLMAGKLQRSAGATTSGDEFAFGADDAGQVLFARNPHAMIRSIRNAVFRRVELAAHDNFEALARVEQQGLPTPAAGAGNPAVTRTTNQLAEDSPAAASPASTEAANRLPGDGGTAPGGGGAYGPAVGGMRGALPDFSDPAVWEGALGLYWDQHEQIGIGQDARAAEFFNLSLHPDATELLLAAGLAAAEELPSTASGDLDWMLVRQAIVDPDGDGDWHLVLLVDRKATLDQNRPVLRTARFGQVT